MKWMQAIFCRPQMALGSGLLGNHSCWTIPAKEKSFSSLTVILRWETRSVYILESEPYEKNHENKNVFFRINSLFRIDNLFQSPWDSWNWKGNIEKEKKSSYIFKKMSILLLVINKTFDNFFPMKLSNWQSGKQGHNARAEFMMLPFWKMKKSGFYIFRKERLHEKAWQTPKKIWQKMIKVNWIVCLISNKI